MHMRQTARNNVVSCTKFSSACGWTKEKFVEGASCPGVFYGTGMQEQVDLSHHNKTSLVENPLSVATQFLKYIKKTNK